MTFRKSFKVGSKAQQYFEGPDALPETWLRRKQDPDFHVDYIVEIDEDDGPSGIKFGVQLKGTESPKYSGGHLKYRLETRHLAYYVDRSPEPVFLVVVDTESMEGYWVHLQGWARGRDGWRSQKTVTVNVPTKNRLEETDVFRAAIRDAVRSTRSVGSAAEREAREFERLDDRFKVSVNHIDGVTRVELNPTKDVEGTISIRGPKAAEKLSQLIEKGQLTEFEPGELSIEGSELFRHMTEETASGRVSLHAAKKLPAQVSILTADERGEEDMIVASRSTVLVVGTQEMHFDVTLEKAPVTMTCTLGMDAVNRLAMGGFNLGFDYDKWLGQDLLLAAHFDPVHRLLKTIIAGKPLILLCEIDGNVLFKSALSTDDPSPFQGVSQVLELLARARTVARHLDVHPRMPRLEDIGPAEDDILYLWELIENGEGSATVKDASAELELSVGDLQRAFGHQSSRGSGLTFQVVEECPPVLGCHAQGFGLQRSIPVELTEESADLLATKKDQSERIAVRVEARPGAACATKLVPMPPVDVQTE